MKPEIECLRCILSTRLKEVEQAGINAKLKLEFARKLALKVLEGFSLDAELTELASEFFRYVALNVPGVVEYYRALKSASNRRALENLPLHMEYASRLEGFKKFNYLVRLSAVANLVDYGVADHKPLEYAMTPHFVEGYAVYKDDSRLLYDLVVRGSLKIVWLFDNAGEAVYDTLLISEIRKWGNAVYGLVKDEPGFQNDISLSDVEQLNLGKLVDGIKSYGCSCSSIHLNHVSEGVRSLIAESDLVVAKGMSHFEYLSDIDLGKPVVFILVPKCDPVARRIGEGSRGKIVTIWRSGGAH